jgi:WD40 repeat protein
MNDRYLVSAGADKVLLVWDYETGERLAKFAQQPNLCAGLHLVHDNVISISIDGVVRTFDIGKKEMIKQCRIADLAKGCLIEEAKEVVSEIGDGVGKGTIKWVSGTGSILTVSISVINESKAEV